MSEMLSADKIASLVEAAKSGDLPEAGAGSGSRRGHRLRTVDFSRPTKFTTEQQRRITRAVETFCQTANTRLSAELRIPMEFELINVVQLTWSAAQNQLPSGTLSALVDVARSTPACCSPSSRRSCSPASRRCWAARRTARPRHGG